MTPPQIFDDLLDQDHQNRIENILTDHWFPWYFNREANGENLKDKNQDANTLEYPQFTHIFFNNQSINSDFFDTAFEILDKFCQSQNLQIEKLIRIKSNFIYKNSDYPCYHYSTPHADVEEDHMTLIYYVCDSDGSTVIFNETQETKQYTINSTLSSKKGRFVYFDGSLYHAGTPPIKDDHRVLINYNFCVKR